MESAEFFYYQLEFHIADQQEPIEELISFYKTIRDKVVCNLDYHYHYRNGFPDVCFRKRQGKPLNTYDLFRG